VCVCVCVCVRLCLVARQFEMPVYMYEHRRKDLEMKERKGRKEGRVEGSRREENDGYVDRK